MGDSDDDELDWQNDLDEVPAIGWDDDEEFGPTTDKHIFHADEQCGSVRLRFGAVSMQGWRDNMEDRVTTYREDPYIVLAVFDGHNGAEAAEYSQEYFPKSLCDHLLEVGEVTEDTIRDAFVSFASEVPGSAGTTATVVVVDGECGKLHLAHIGDSRAIVFDFEANVLHVTRDHQPDDEKEKARLVDQAGVRPLETATLAAEQFTGFALLESRLLSPQLSDTNVARAFGDDNFKVEGRTPDKQPVCVIPDYYAVDIPAGEPLCVLLASDGIWNSCFESMPGCMSPEDEGPINFVTYLLKHMSLEEVKNLLESAKDDESLVQPYANMWEATNVVRRCALEAEEAECRSGDLNNDLVDYCVRKIIHPPSTLPEAEVRDDYPLIDGPDIVTDTGKLAQNGKPAKRVQWNRQLDLCPAPGESLVARPETYCSRLSSIFDQLLADDDLDTCGKSTDNMAAILLTVHLQEPGTEEEEPEIAPEHEESLERKLNRMALRSVKKDSELTRLRKRLEELEGVSPSKRRRSADSDESDNDNENDTDDDNERDANHGNDRSGVRDHHNGSIANGDDNDKSDNPDNNQHTSRGGDGDNHTDNDKEQRERIEKERLDREAMAKTVAELSEERDSLRRQMEDKNIEIAELQTQVAQYSKGQKAQDLQAATMGLRIMNLQGDLAKAQQGAQHEASERAKDGQASSKVQAELKEMQTLLDTEKAKFEGLERMVRKFGAPAADAGTAVLWDAIDMYMKRVSAWHRGEGSGAAVESAQMALCALRPTDRTPSPVRLQRRRGRSAERRSPNPETHAERGGGGGVVVTPVADKHKYKHKHRGGKGRHLVVSDLMKKRKIKRALSWNGGDTGWATINRRMGVGELVRNAQAQDLVPQLHVNARKKTIYRNRLTVLDAQVGWQHPWPAAGNDGEGVYAPPEYSKGCEAETEGATELAEGLRPLNPRGRTGLRGRGVLSQYGANLRAEPVFIRVTREKSPSPSPSASSPSPQSRMEVLVTATATGGWALPSGFVSAGEVVPASLLEALTAVVALAEKATPHTSDNLSRLLRGQADPEGAKDIILISKEYFDDERNTDNAWIDTLSVVFPLAEAPGARLTFPRPEQGGGVKVGGHVWLSFDEFAKSLGSGISTHQLALLMKAREAAVKFFRPTTRTRPPVPRARTQSTTSVPHTLVVTPCRSAPINTAPSSPTRAPPSVPDGSLLAPLKRGGPNRRSLSGGKQSPPAPSRPAPATPPSPSTPTTPPRSRSASAQPPDLHLPSKKSSSSVLLVPAAALETGSTGTHGTHADSSTAFFAYERLTTSGGQRNWPPEVLPSKREAHLSDADFETVFGMNKPTFYALPNFKRIQLKKAKALF